MSTDTRSRVDKGVSTGGQFAKEAKSEDDSVTLAAATRSGIVSWPGASVPLAYELNEGGIVGTLSPEDDIDDNLPHSAARPQQRFITAANRAFTIGTSEGGQIEVAPTDMRDDDGYFTVEGSADDPAGTVRSAMRQSVVESHADSVIQLPGDLELRDLDVAIDSETGRARLALVVSDDDGDFTTIKFDPSDQSFTAQDMHSPAEGETPPTSDELLEKLENPINAHSANELLERVRNDPDTDIEMIKAIDASFANEPQEEQQVPEALLREYFHSDNADILDVQVPETRRPTVKVDFQDDDDSAHYALTADLASGTMEIRDKEGSIHAAGQGAVDAAEHFGLPSNPEHYRKFHQEFLARKQG